MTAARELAPRLPPRPFVRVAWVLHRAVYRLSGGPIGLSRPEAGGRFGMMRRIEVLARYLFAAAGRTLTIRARCWDTRLNQCVSRQSHLGLRAGGPELWRELGPSCPSEEVCAHVYRHARDSGVPLRGRAI